MHAEDIRGEEGSCLHVKCHGTIIEKDVLNGCESEEIANQDTVKVPVVLGEFTIQFAIESKIKLPEPVLEIKRIKKNVFLTESRLTAGTNKVFIKGFIRKNIEYAAINCVTPKAIIGDVKHATVHLPFQCAAEVRNMKDPQLEPNSPNVEIYYYDEENIGIDMKGKELISEETFNERIYIELEHSSIYEANIIEDPKEIGGHKVERRFQCFTEKEVICLTIKLLQNQQICGDFEILKDRYGS